ncbi:MAG: O-antigen ligase family protein [Candidatus Thiodiazotropha sp.]
MPSPDQLRILILVVPIILFLIGIGRPVYAVIGYMVLVYCKVGFYYPITADIRAELVFGMIVLAMVLATGNLKKYFSNDESSIGKLILFLTLSIALSFMIAWEHQYSWDNAVYHYIKTMLLFVMIVGAIGNEKDLKVFVFGYLAMYLYLAYEPMYGFVQGIGGSVHTYGTNYIAESGILAGHVALANNMNQMLPLAWYIFWGSDNKYLKFIAGFAFTVFMLALVGSGSRGGVVGMAVWGLLVVWFSKQRLKAFLAMSVVAVVLVMTQSSSIVSTASRIDSSSAHGRLTGLTHGIGMIQRGNLLGVGPGCYLFARREYFSYTMESHNIYGQIMGDLGIPGVIVTFLLMRRIFQAINKTKNKLINDTKHKFIYYLMLGIMVSLITRLVISMASHGLYFFYWYVMAALVMVSYRLVMSGELEKDTEKKKTQIKNKFAVPQ